MKILELILATVVPGALWLIIIWLTIPHKTINLKNASKFFLAGVASTALVGAFLSAVPDFYELNSRKVNEIIGLTFGRIAPLEETIKIALFCWAVSGITRLHPASCLAYGAFLGLGFAIIENIDYGAAYGSSVVILRSLTATVLHVGTGIVFAWFYAQSARDHRWSRNRMDVIFKKYPAFQSRLFQTMGLLVCIWIHGHYDFLVLNREPMPQPIFFLILLVVTTWFMARDLQRPNVNNYLR
jgi:RsiW-degrading membrane proteinase PrsW (M82 family)